ncbi:MAG TPA: hypothetical protein VGF45_04685, partial [Polyangia bacterium]
MVNSVRTQRPTYTTVHLAFAAHRRGHDAAFVSVDRLSHDGTHVWGTMTRLVGGRLRTTVEYLNAVNEAPSGQPERLDDFDVV